MNFKTKLIKVINDLPTSEDPKQATLTLCRLALQSEEYLVNIYTEHPRLDTYPDASDDRYCLLLGEYDYRQNAEDRFWEFSTAVSIIRKALLSTI